MSVHRKVAISAMFLVGFLSVLPKRLWAHPDVDYTDDSIVLLVLALLVWLRISSRLMVRSNPYQGTSNANDDFRESVKSRFHTSVLGSTA